MLEACDVWQPITEAVLMSSEDESWLQQARFKFSDDSDSDEAESAVNQAYLQAVAALKQAGQAGQSQDKHSAPAEKFVLHSQSTSGSLKAPASVPSGHSVLSLLAQQMAQAIADAAIQVVQARKQQQQQGLQIMAGLLDAGSQAAGAADHRCSSSSSLKAGQAGAATYAARAATSIAHGATATSQTGASTTGCTTVTTVTTMGVATAAPSLATATKTRLEECAQEAFAKAALKAQQGPVKAPQPQPGVKKDIGRKKTKAEYKAEHIKRLRRGTRHIDNSLRGRVVHVAPSAVKLAPALLKAVLKHAHVMQPLTEERLLTWKIMKMTMKQFRRVLNNGLSDPVVEWLVYKVT
ncbi:MAG: hypothetical protein FRX49_09118 [Trebouxia sp. A1-2]|nr:MAG: hypothetical protein FRX49_09118 [Trebouxia sp. A1-2]